MTHRVVLDSTAARSPGRNTEINGELGLPPPLTQDTTAWLVPVDPMDDAIERLGGVHPDGHAAADTLNIHAGDEFLRLAGLCRDLKVIITITDLLSRAEYQWEQVMIFVCAGHDLLQEH